MSRQFATVGVLIPAPRLRELASGAPASEAEQFDMAFALAVRDLQRDSLATRYVRARRRCGRCLLVAAMTVLATATLVSATYLMLSLAITRTP